MELSLCAHGILIRFKNAINKPADGGGVPQGLDSRGRVAARGRGGIP